MKTYYSYIRISTAKQGEGASLDVQKDTNDQYAEKRLMKVVREFREIETAAKQGRTVFNEMIRLLKTGKADGVIIHKIDRSARNLKDWAEIGNLIDQGIEVHFSHESLDMQARGGRLSADIQAVIAADYIRNLRQEAIKGIYGRLNQGIYPFRAPVGYLDQGKGKAKTLNPLQAPIVRQAFELYATRKYSLDELSKYLNVLGLRSVNDAKINANGLSLILNNTFYVGIITIKGQKFNGKHEALISPVLFKQVQAILKGNTNQKISTHDFKFRKQVKCNTCGYSLTAELQKSNIYYRCHTKSCVTNSIRENTIDTWLKKILTFISFHDSEIEEINENLKETECEWQKKHQELVVAVKIKKGQLEQKIERLTDCYIESGLDKEMYQERKEKLLMDYKEKEAAEQQLLQNGKRVLTKARKFFELATNLIKSYETAILDEKRELIEIITSNLAVEGKKPLISMKSPFSKLYQRQLSISGGPIQGTLRQTDSKCIITDPDSLPEKRKPMSKEEIKLLFDELLLEFGEMSDDSFLDFHRND